ncbi:MBL fold metallo-hydrolase [Billgrantia saliphila]|uniref:MBL fold metallo-hydrolase n=1 Tax=Billgrantia saliphila TaxID=1848458 RepID=UPI000CE36AA2|nr:MBL fold metallo-hydrolase [Halomonas saliphila]
MITRRSMLKGSLASAALGLFGGAVMPFNALARAPLAGMQAPGYYRKMLGNFELTALSDGTIDLPLDTLYKNTLPEHVEERLAEIFQLPTTHISVNAYLLNAQQRLILLDTGTGSLLGPQLGRLPDNLRASGYHPEQVDDIVLTHIHTDHSGGLVLNGQSVFPNATLHVPQRELDFWLSRDQADKASEALKPMFREARNALSPYIESDRLKPFADNAAPIAGVVRSVLRNGHTPGHSALVVESQGETFVYWGDITHGDALQFDDPGIAIDFDIDSAQAIASRQAAFADAAREQYLVGGAHIAFPGLGHVRRDSDNYDWVPLNYQTPL